MQPPARQTASASTPTIQLPTTTATSEVHVDPTTTNGASKKPPQQDPPIATTQPPEISINRGCAKRQAFVHALYRLGMMYKDGVGVQRDRKKAAELFFQAQQLGHSNASSAFMALNSVFDSAHSTQQDGYLNQSILLLRQADDTYASTLHELGLAYLSGSNVEKNDELARHSFGQAANLGFAASMTALGQMENKAGKAELATSWFQQAAKKGNAHAMHELGIAYLLASGIEKNDELARHWFEQAANLGVLAAMVELGWMEKRAGKPELATSWFQQAANKGYADAMHELGIAYLWGSGIEKNDGLARHWFEQAANLGFPPAMIELGYMEQRAGKPELATPWFQQAANKGHAHAMYEFGFAYLLGSGIEKNDELARHWFEQAANLGIPAAMTELGRMEKRAGKPELAIPWFQQAANKGHAHAMFEFGSAYRLGSGIEKNDELACHWFEQAANLGIPAAMTALGLMKKNAGEDKSATRWFLRAADKGDARAMYYLACAYHLGTGIDMNVELAHQWALKAANKGFAKAMVMVGTMEKNAHRYDSAFRWYQQAANLNDPEANHWVGWAYRYGLGVTIDFEQAILHYQKAANLGFRHSNSVLSFLLTNMYWNGSGVKQDTKDLRTQLEAAANDGDASAMNELGILDQRANNPNAFNWYKKATEIQDLPEAKSNLGYMYYSGFGVEQNTPKAIECFTSAATNLEKPNAHANFLLGHIEETNKNYQLALGWYEKASNLGHIPAFSSIARLYYQGTLGNKDEAKASLWYEKAIKLGCSSAICGIAQLYNDERRWDDALSWYNKAAAWCDPKSLTAVGQLYAKLGSFSDARRNFQLAADMGISDGYTGLGQLYENGQGVDINKKKALEFYKRAIEVIWKGDRTASALFSFLNLIDDPIEARRIKIKSPIFEFGRLLTEKVASGLAEFIGTDENLKVFGVHVANDENLGLLIPGFRANKTLEKLYIRIPKVSEKTITLLHSIFEGNSVSALRRITTGDKDADERLQQFLTGKQNDLSVRRDALLTGAHEHEIPQEIVELINGEMRHFWVAPDKVPSNKSPELSESKKI